MRNIKTCVGKYAPNPKEFNRWVDITSDVNGSVIKVYRNGKWVDENQNETVDQSTKEQADTVIDNWYKELQQRVDNLTDKLNYLYREFKRMKKVTAIVE